MCPDWWIVSSLCTLMRWGIHFCPMWYWFENWNLPMKNSVLSRFWKTEIWLSYGWHVHKSISAACHLSQIWTHVCQWQWYTYSWHILFAVGPMACICLVGQDSTENFKTACSCIPMHHMGICMWSFFAMDHHPPAPAFAGIIWQWRKRHWQLENTPPP